MRRLKSAEKQGRSASLVTTRKSALFCRFVEQVPLFIPFYSYDSHSCASIYTSNGSLFISTPCDSLSIFKCIPWVHPPWVRWYVGGGWVSWEGVRQHSCFETRLSSFSSNTSLSLKLISTILKLLARTQVLWTPSLKC